MTLYLTAPFPDTMALWVLSKPLSTWAQCKRPNQRFVSPSILATSSFSCWQNLMSELERQGVFQRPEDIGITIEYLNPSFLVPKPSGGHRLVTAFADVARYSKPQPSLMPDVETTLRTIARWKYLTVTDLTSAFCQIPLATESMKYCGVATPFRGIRA